MGQKHLTGHFRWKIREITCMALKQFSFFTDTELTRCFRGKEGHMTHQQALKILMLSPLYFKLGTAERMQLVKEYCKMYGEVRKNPRGKGDRNE